MANRYNFASTGAAAVDELTKMLAEREAQRQQEFLNAITLQREDRAFSADKRAREEAEEEARLRKRNILLSDMSMYGANEELSPEMIAQAKELGIPLNQQMKEEQVAPQGDSETEGTMDVRQIPGIISRRQTPQERTTQENRDRMGKLATSLSNAQSRQEATRMAIEAGVPPAQVDDVLNAFMGPKGRQVAGGSFEEYLQLKHGGKHTAEQALAARKEWEAANDSPESGGGGSPYYLPQTAYDSKGVPVGAYSFNARTGKAEMLPLPIEGTTLKPPPSSIGNQMLIDEATTASLGNLKALYDAGGKNYVGPASGRWETFKQVMPGVGTEQQFNSFAAANAALTNDVIRAITGAAVGVQEQARIMAQIPTVNDKPEVWEAKFNETLKNLQYLTGVIQKRQAAGAAAAPGAPAPPPGAGGSGVVKWEKGPDGRPRRAQ